MKYRYFFFLMSTIVVFWGCTSDKKTDVEGVWQLVSGEYNYQDMTVTLQESECLKSYKFITKTHYVVITQDTSQQLYFAHCGTFKMSDSEYIEKFEIHKNPKNIGKSLIFKSHIRDDKWVISSDRLHEVWKKHE